MYKNVFSLLLVILITFNSCKKPYDPKVDENIASILVVEGYINTGIGPTKFIISKAAQLSATNSFIPENGATVTVESSGGVSQNLTALGNGVYQHTQLNINTAQKYRLKIRTSTGKNYASDFVDVKVTPNIDKVAWKEVQGGVQITADTHDAQAKSRYYMWDFEDTWLFNSNFDSEVIFKGGAMQARTVEESVYRCWASGRSTSIILGNSLKLTEDIISQQPILLIPTRSEKLGIRYSILVKQYALTKEAFEYMEIMKKNTEELGSIFGPLPSQQIGNIKNVDDQNEIVVGFVYATSKTEARIFINNSDISYVWNVTKPNSDTCSENEIMQTSNLGQYFAAGNLVPTYQIYDASGNSVIGYGFAPRICVDCTLRGTKTMPPFWQ